MHKRKVEVVKIDVEGHQVPVLKGMQLLVSQFRPSIVVEVDALSRLEVEKLLAPLGYDFLMIDKTDLLCTSRTGTIRN